MDTKCTSKKYLEVADDELKKNQGNSKQSKCIGAVWTKNDTITLLKAYENKLEMLETPKKKTRIWVAISGSLKEHKIKVTPDQVRWKINALAKKYKQCFDSGDHKKFRYFKEMDNIYSKYNVECADYIIQSTEKFDRKTRVRGSQLNVNDSKTLVRSFSESRAMIELRKMRLGKRIEADRSQSKICLERQWLDYLKIQEEHRMWRDENFDRNLKLREEELELRKKELALKESLELRQIDVKERDQEELIEIESKKCDFLKSIFSQDT